MRPGHPGAGRAADHPPGVMWPGRLRWPWCRSCGASSGGTRRAEAAADGAVELDPGLVALGLQVQLGHLGRHVLGAAVAERLAAAVLDLYFCLPIAPLEDGQNLAKNRIASDSTGQGSDKLAALVDGNNATTATQRNAT